MDGAACTPAIAASFMAMARGFLTVSKSPRVG
jgi:hypothetical protein